MQGSSKNSAAKLLVGLLLIILVGLVFFLGYRRGMQEATMQQNGTLASEEAKKVVEKVRRHILIPAGVAPTVARIVDVEKLRKQNPIYNKAKNGDRLIITTDQAILYDPDRDIILAVVPVVVQPTPPAAQAGAAAQTQ